MNKTEMTGLDRGCPACRSRNSLPGGQKAEFDILNCRDCGSIFTSSIPTLAHAQDYDDYYSAANLTVPEFTHKRLDEIVAGFEKYRGANRLLEVGFGAGSFLQAAARGGWNVEGVEISKTACDHSSAAGFKTFCGELSEAHYPDADFDVVIASELLEHVPEPSSIIREVARIVRPGGLFWATTPNAKGLSSRLLGLEWSVLSPPEHLHLFSASGLKGLLLECGFRRVEINTEGVNPFELMKKLRRPEPIDQAVSTNGNDRVSSGYRLNEAMATSGTRKTIKNSINSLLRVSRLGDSLKIWAER
ncbi:MAG TPA: class I SAM-dependent methyltransferase [Pyrinomonadaceae bacterium]|nr:class I SAM-dependent methyltransferase [Pyrinomonadaceae bacterium]